MEIKAIDTPLQNDKNSTNKKSMNKTRLEFISDGIFAIVMTLLVIEIKVPELHFFSEHILQEELIHLAPLFAAYFLSFAVLANFWIINNFLFSSVVEKINRELIYLNFIKLSFVSLIPFSAYLLGQYPQTQTAVIVYAVNMLAIALSVFLIRTYITRSPKIENHSVDPLDQFYGNIRITLSILFPVLAIAFAFVNTNFSLLLHLILVIITVTPGLVAWFANITGLDRKAKHAMELSKKNK